MTGVTMLIAYGVLIAEFTLKWFLKGDLQLRIVLSH